MNLDSDQVFSSALPGNFAVLQAGLPSAGGLHGLPSGLFHALPEVLPAVLLAALLLAFPPSPLTVFSALFPSALHAILSGFP